jgi:5-carboxymethyl-2-hydroxymuconate isomerase
VPHITIEYSANLETEVDPMAIVRTVHATVLAEPIFDAVGARTRAVRHEHFLVADGESNHGFVAVTARIGPGRTVEQRKAASQRIMAALYLLLGETYERRGLLLSVEVSELDSSAMTRRNSLRERSARQTSANV